MVDKIKNNKELTLIPILLLIITIITIKVVQNQKIFIDELGYNLIVQNRNTFLTTIMKILTNLGDLHGIIIITILLLIFLKNKIDATMPAINVGILAITNKIIKTIIKRPRPTYKLIKIGGYSFPSGHSMASIALYGSLMILTYKYIKDKTKRNIIISILTLIIITVGISRIYLGVHYTSDVIVGYSVSTIYLIICNNITKRIKE